MLEHPVLDHGAAETETETPSRDQSPHVPVTTIAGRYELRGLIGRGGTAKVYRGWDRTLDRSVAVKVIPAEPDAQGAGRRAGEAKLLASQNHGSLVTLHDAVVTQDATYLVMELMEGGTLSDRIRTGPIPPLALAAVAGEVARALDHIHTRGIVHRDVKPANVLLAHTGVPLVAKLSDFGIAKLLESPGRTTGVLGTAQYVSPEQARGDHVGPPSDVYSLGITLIEALTGEPAFPGTATESVMARLIRDPDVPGFVGYEWRSLLTAMTARDPEGRPAAAAVARRAQDLLRADDTEQRLPVPGTEPLALSTMQLPGLEESASASGTQHLRPRLALIGALPLAALLVGVVLLGGAFGPPRADHAAGSSSSPAATSPVTPSTTSAPATASTPSRAPAAAAAAAAVIVTSSTPPAVHAAASSARATGTANSSGKAKATSRSATRSKSQSQSQSKSKSKTAKKHKSNGNGNGNGNGKKHG